MADKDLKSELIWTQLSTGRFSRSLVTNLTFKFEN